MDTEDFREDEIRKAAEQFGEHLDNGDYNYRDAEELDELIEYYINEGQLNRAMKAVELGLDWHPFDTAILAKKAYIFYITGRSPEALYLVERAILMEPGDSDLHTLKGEVLSHLEEFQEAIRSFEKALEHSEEKSEIFLSMAFTYQSWGKPLKSVHYLKMILDDQFENDQMLYEISYCYDLMENSESAIAFFTQYLDKHPYSCVAWFNLGQWYQKQDDFDKAIWSYDFSIATIEHYAPAYLQKGICLFELEKYNEAIEAFNQNLEYNGPDALIYCHIANCHQELGAYREARGFYKMAVKDDPTLADAWFGIGLTFKFEGNMNQAINYFQRAIKLDTEEADYLIELGEVYLSLDDYEKAEEMYEKITRLEPQLAEGWLDLALCRLELGHSETAITTLLSGEETNPENHKIIYRLSSYYYLSGQSIKGFEYLTLALCLNWEDHFLLFEHAPFLQHVESVAETIDLYRQI
jgi:tetratricopeptide (TPR) repeat protein